MKKKKIFFQGIHSFPGLLNYLAWFSLDLPTMGRAMKQKNQWWSRGLLKLLFVTVGLLRQCSAMTANMWAGLYS